MINEAISTVALPSLRLILLTNNELLESALRQHLQNVHNCRLDRHRHLPPRQSEGELVLVDIASYSHEDCQHLLRQLGDMPTALINAQAEQASELLVQFPWIKGVFYATASRASIIQGLNTILAGGDWLPRALMEKLLGRYRQLTQPSQAVHELSLREKEILALAGKGLSNAEIAARLHLSPHTIKSHIHNALGKLGAANRAQGASLVLAHAGGVGL